MRIKVVADAKVPIIRCTVDSIPVSMNLVCVVVHVAHIAIRSIFLLFDSKSQQYHTTSIFWTTRSWKASMKDAYDHWMVHIWKGGADNEYRTDRAGYKF